MAPRMSNSATVGVVEHSTGTEVAFVVLNADGALLAGVACDTPAAMQELAEALLCCALRFYQHAGVQPDLSALADRHLKASAGEYPDAPPIPDDRPPPRHGG